MVDSYETGRISTDKVKVFKGLFHHFSLGGPENLPSTAVPLSHKRLKEAFRLCPRCVGQTNQQDSTSRCQNRPKPLPVVLRTRRKSPTQKGGAGEPGTGQPISAPPESPCCGRHRRFPGRAPGSHVFSACKKKTAKSVLVFIINCNQDKLLVSKMVLLKHA